MTTNQSNLTSATILALANNPETPKFKIGTQALTDWHSSHRNPHTGKCHTDSGWYVVEHDVNYRVLSRWFPEYAVPSSHDVPELVAA